jgi:serine/threonine protein kinase
MQGINKVAIKVVRKLTDSDNADDAPGSISASTSMASLASMRSNSGLELVASTARTGGGVGAGGASGTNNGTNNTCDPEMEDVQRLLDHECKIWSSLQHPHILQMMDVMEVEDALFVVSELAEGGTLLDYIQKRVKANAAAATASSSGMGSNGNLNGGSSMSSMGSHFGMFGGGGGGGGGWGSMSNLSLQQSQGPIGLTESEARRIFRQIASAVQYLHCVAGIVHRDIKCENILVMQPPQDTNGSKMVNEPSSAGNRETNNSMDTSDASETSGSYEGAGILVKLADFGLSDYITTSPPTSPSTLIASDPIFCMGSLHYCAPEELRATVQKSPASDVWSLACVLYALLTGSLPFQDGFLPRLQAMIINGRYDVGKLDRCGVSKEGKELLVGMFKVKVEQRLSIQEVCEHPWMRMTDGM